MITSFLENYWWAAVMGAALVIWAWRASRQRTRPPTGAVYQAAPFRRDEFATMVATVHKQMEKGSGTGMALFFLGFLALWIVSQIAPNLPRSLMVTGVIALVGAIVSSGVAYSRRGQRLMREAGLVCPACGLPPIVPRGFGDNVQTLLVDATCQRCGMPLADRGQL